MARGARPRVAQDFLAAGVVKNRTGVVALTPLVKAETVIE